MSDADDSSFDKEAERERLREQYEAEQADREAAQQMSDLLLKGATMTNSHCGSCGSPIFRVDGREFCPNCSAEGPDDAEATTDADAGATAGADAESTESARSATADESSLDEQPADVVPGTADRSGDGSASTGGTSIAERAAASVQAGDAREGQDPAGGDADESSPAANPGDDATLADAQQSLLNAIVHHARAATDADPRTARDHLDAANEAAEALATISQ